MKVIYMRVSKKDLSYEDQLPFILKKFNLDKKECLIITEKVSAFNEEAQKKRTEFIKLKQLIEEGQVEELYVYKVDRLERNMQRMFELFFFCEAFNCRIYSAEEPMINQEFEKSAQGDFLRYINILLFGTQAQGESENTSKRTKKAYTEGFSSYGKKWGRKFKDVYGKEIELLEKDVKGIGKTIAKMSQNTYKEIQEAIAKKYKVKVSNAFISKTKNGETK